MPGGVGGGCKANVEILRRGFGPGERSSSSWPETEKKDFVRTSNSPALFERCPAISSNLPLAHIKFKVTWPGLATFVSDRQILY